MIIEKEIENLRKEEDRLHEELQKHEVLSDEYKELQNRLSTVHRQLIDYASVTVDVMKESTAYEKEIHENINTKRKQIIDICLGVAGLAIPVIFNCYWLINGFKFEETGSISSRTFNWLINNQFKKK